MWTLDWIACSQFNKVNRFLWFCHEAIKFVAPGGQLLPKGLHAPGSPAGCCPVEDPRIWASPPQVMPLHCWPGRSSFHAHLMTRKICGSTVSVKVVTPWNQSGQDQGWEPGQIWCESSELPTCSGELTCTVHVSRRKAGWPVTTRSPGS